MDIFEVRTFINKECVSIEIFRTLDEAIAFANRAENSEYICEITKYKYYCTISREFWRDANTTTN